ncbi:MAG: hypothetical protein LUC06_04035, partial [Oscillospiraceae bacterium]|nr:hypothetical protein [Oscillospiraceae bacterium]
AQTGAGTADRETGENGPASWQAAQKEQFPPPQQSPERNKGMNGAFRKNISFFMGSGLEETADRASCEAPKIEKETKKREPPPQTALPLPLFYNMWLWFARCCLYIRQRAGHGLAEDINMECPNV